MKTIDFSAGWRYAHLGEDDWQEVTLPHDAMLSEPRNGMSAGGTNTGWFEARNYEYRKDFEAPQDAAYLEFEGVYHRAEVELDGVACKAHPNGYFGFRVPVTAGSHSIRVIARNAEQPSSRWYSGAGIYRPVTLVCLPGDHILPESIAIDTVDTLTCHIRVSFRTTKPGPTQVIILDGKTVLDEEAAAEGVADLYCKGAQPWSPDHPKLYTCRLTFGEDVQEVRFGIRTVEVDAKEGFRINGKRVLLLGACIHHDNGILGAAGHPFAERRKIELLKQAGYNAIRSAHNPISKAILDACDELGMLVMDEYADMWYIHKTQYDYADFFEKNWKEDLKLLVEKDRNHPSVVMYSIGNEVAETAQPRGIALTEQMTRYLHSLDRRPVTCGINIFFNYLSSLGFGVYSDEKAKAEAAKAANTSGKTKKKAVGSEFINNVAGLLGAGFMKFGATLHGSDVKTRDAYAKLDVAGYNYGVNRYKKDLMKYPDRVILGSETFAADAGTFYDLAKDHPALIGDFVWTGIDYLGEVGLGAWEYKEYAPTFEHDPGWITAGAGSLDLIGTSTGQMAYTQVAYGRSPIRIGVVPVKFAKEKHSPAAWRFTNTMESWSWNGCDGMQTTVEVYARGCEAELLLNGQSIGKKRLSQRHLASFPVTYHDGTLEAVSYDADGQEIARTALTTAGKETKLTLLPESKAVKTDELLYVRLRYTDENGTVKPLERGKIKLSITGGKLLALGNACSYNESGYLSDATDTYYGEALAIIQPNESASVSVQAQSSYGTEAVSIPVVMAIAMYP